MKNLFVVIILVSLSLAAKAESVWGDNTLEESSGPAQVQDQDQLIKVELDDEIQQASGLKNNKEQKAEEAKPVVVEKPLTEEMAIANMGKEIDAAEAKAQEADVEAQKEEARLQKMALVEKKKLNQLKVLKVSKKMKTLSSKGKPSKAVII